MDKNITTKPMMKTPVISPNIGSTPTSDNLSPADRKKKRFMERLMAFFQRGQRLEVTSKHAKAYTYPDYDRMMAKKKTRRQMANVSRKANRGRKGKTALHQKKDY